MRMSGGARPPVLLRPVVAAADRMRTSLRLGTLVLVLMVPGIVATYAYTAEANQKIAFSALERVGTDVVRPTLLAMADVVAGRAPDLAAVRDAAARRPELKLDAAVAKVPGTAATATQRHASVVALAGLITEAGNSSNLILDPDLDSFYVMDVQIVQLPKALVAAAAAAAADGADTGNGAVAAQAVHAGELSGVAETLRTDIATAQANTALSGLDTRLAALSQAADALAALAKNLTETLATPAPADAGATAVAIGAAVPAVIDVLNDLLATRIDGFTSERLTVLVVAIGGFILAAWFAAAVLWRTRHDVALAVTGVTAIADGDFAGRALPTGSDELGDIGRALGAARSRLIAQETQLQAAATVREEQLQVSFQHQRQAELRLRNRAQAIIDESTSVIAEQLRLVTAQVGDVRHASDTIDTGISLTDAATTAVVDHAHQAERVISSLEQSLQRVAATAAVVNGIAGQTRLLALNATIEAARAGELGLGFTVVADEVKELATTTSKSTEQIAQTIEELERDTAAMSATIVAMVTGIGGVGQAATSLRAVAVDQGAVVGRLADQVGETIGRVEQMSGLAAQLERRGSDRVTVSGPILMRRPGVAEPIEALLLNVSPGGLRLRIDPSVRAGLGDVLETDLGSGAGRIEVHTQIVNRDRRDDGDELGLEFLIPDEEQAARIDDYVAGLFATAGL
jgi:methyl-accepting chemotaxis protein